MGSGQGVARPEVLHATGAAACRRPGMETIFDEGPVEPTWETCCWLAALGMAAGLEGWWPEYWLIRAAEGWRRSSMPN